MDQLLHAVYMQVSYILHCWIIESISSQTMKNSFYHDVLLINLIYSDLKSHFPLWCLKIHLDSSLVCIIPLCNSFSSDKLLKVGHTPQA